MGPEGDSSLEEMLEDPNALSPAKGLLSEDLEQEAAIILESLSDFESQVLRLRFGIAASASTRCRRSARCSA